MDFGKLLPAALAEFSVYMRDSSIELDALESDPLAKLLERFALEHALGHELPADSPLSKSSDDGWDESLTTTGGEPFAKRGLDPRLDRVLRKVLPAHAVEEATLICRQAIAAARAGAAG